VNIHDEAPVRGRTVRDCAGHRLGRVVEIAYAATGTSEASYLLRLTGWWREYRAVPAASARRGTRRSLQLAFTRAAVLASPQLSRGGCRHGVSRRELHAVYPPAGRV
jgi:hypothetical protein